MSGRIKGAALALLAVVVLAAPVLVLSAFVLHTVSSDVVARGASNRLGTVDLAARLIDGRLTTAGAELVSVAGRASLRDALRARDAAGIAVHLHDLKASSVGYTTAVALDPRGIFLVGDPNDPAVVGRDLSARDYFVGGMAATGPFTSEAFAAAGGPVPVAVAVSLAVRDERGVLGLILVGLAPQLVLASLDPIATMDGREILILDKAGRVISSTNPARKPLAAADVPGFDPTKLDARGVAQFSDGQTVRIVTYARVPSAAWTLLVIDDPAVLLAIERRLENDITNGVMVAVGAALLAGVVLAVLNATLQRRREELAAATAKAEGELSRINAVMASVEDGLYTVDQTGTFASMNPAAERMLGWTSAELQGRNMHEAVHHLRRDGSANPAVTCPLLGVLRTGQPVRVSSDTLVRRDGSFLPARLSSAPIRRGGQVTGAVVSFSDITAELASAAAVEAAKEAAEAANQAKSAFLANMSHELRTPLNAILGFSQLLEERLGASLEDRQRGWLRNVQGAGTHLLELINDVLDISKVEAGRYEIRPEQITLADLLAPVLSAARQDAEARGLTFEASDVPAIAVLVDPLRVRQVLHNLLSNALKFTERGGRVRLAAGLAGRDLRFLVSDTGIGIPPADQGRVFGAFERLHEGRHAASGTGLGLALTKRIVELHGGSISFTSEEGVGTTFSVSLPGVVHAEMVGPRVLIVEDHPRDAALVAALVAEAGLPVEIASTGATALATIRRDLPTAIVLDLRLPDMRGEAVLEVLQAESATRRIPVIVVTVEDDDGRTRPLGAADHLPKPIDAARLRRWLERVSDGQRGGG